MRLAAETESVSSNASRVLRVILWPFLSVVALVRLVDSAVVVGRDGQVANAAAGDVQGSAFLDRLAWSERRSGNVSDRDRTDPSRNVDANGRGAGAASTLVLDRE